MFKHITTCKTGYAHSNFNSILCSFVADADLFLTKLVNSIPYIKIFKISAFHHIHCLPYLWQRQVLKSFVDRATQICKVGVINDKYQKFAQQHLVPPPNKKFYEYWLSIIRDGICRQICPPY